MGSDDGGEKNVDDDTDMARCIVLHWPVDPPEIRKYIPGELELDLYDNRSWNGIVLFNAYGTRVGFLPPLPGSANFSK